MALFQSCDSATFGFFHPLCLLLSATNLKRDQLQMPDDEPSPKSEKQDDTGFIPGDDLWAQWTNWFRRASGRMSDETTLQYRKARDKRKEAADCAECEKNRDYLLTYSKLSTLGKLAWSSRCYTGPIIRFMRQKINKLGADLNNKNIHCRRCDELKGGGFDKSYGIILCANVLQDRDRVEDAIAHGTLAQV